MKKYWKSIQGKTGCYCFFAEFTSRASEARRQARQTASGLKDSEISKITSKIANNSCTNESSQ